MFRAKLANKYIFFEMLPSLLMGIIVFISILLMFQALRLTEFVLIHGVQISVVAEIMAYLSISFLPVILPMSLLFSIMSTYARLSADSEIVALKALGLNIYHLVVPAIILAALTAFFSAQTSFYLAPWGNRRFEVLINEIAQVKVGATIKEGVFSEGFFDLVIYANQVDEKAGRLRQVFIYDERTPDAPFTIIAHEGEIEHETSRAGASALLRLIDGSIHRTVNQTYTKIDFKTYDINLFDPTTFQEKEKSLPSLTLDELRVRMDNAGLEQATIVKAQLEYHRRIALSIGCLLFGLVGVGLGVSTNRRAGKSASLVLCLAILVGYWLSFVSVEGLSKNGWVAPWFAFWLVNIVFGTFSIWSVTRHYR